MSCPLSCLQSRYDAKSGNRCLNQLCLESDSDFPSHSWIDLDVTKTSWTPNLKIPMIGDVLKPNSFQEALENGVIMISFCFFIFSGIFSPLAAPTPCCTREDTGKSKVMSVGLRVISKLKMQNEWMAIVHRQSKPTTISVAPMRQNLL